MPWEEMSIAYPLLNLKYQSSTGDFTQTYTTLHNAFLYLNSDPKDVIVTLVTYNRDPNKGILLYENILTR